MLIDVPVLDGVSKKDVARNITVDEADAGAVGLAVFRRCSDFGTHDVT